MASKKSAVQPIQRVFSKSQKFFSDLFKLKVAPMLQYHGWTEGGKRDPFDERGALINDWVTIEHCHMFHTMDSKGKEHEYCSPAGGHFHKMDVIKDANGEILEVKCASGPLKFEVKKKYGKTKREAVPVNEHDTHTHEVVYQKSDELSRPKANAEAAKFMVMQANNLSKKVTDETGKKLDDLQVTEQ